VSFIGLGGLGVQLQGSGFVSSVQGGAVGLGRIVASANTGFRFFV
jgi:hypothetical protein